MANRVTVTIRSRIYPILAEEAESYIHQCADLVSRELGRAMDGTTLSLDDGAVLACMNLADQYYKERQVSDNLRAQLKQALDENARLRRPNQPKRAARSGAKRTEAPAPAFERESAPMQPSVAENGPAAEKVSVLEKAPAAETVPATEEAPAVQEAPVAETAPAAEKPPAVEKAPAAEKAPTVETAPVMERAPAVEKARRTKKTPSTKKEHPAIEDPGPDQTRLPIPGTPRKP